MPSCKIIAATMIGVLVLSLSACNTMRGVGRDLESVANTGEEVIS